MWTKCNHCGAILTEFSQKCHFCGKSSSSDARSISSGSSVFPDELLNNIEEKS
jgi:uncharacterized OB-fold protein